MGSRGELDNLLSNVISSCKIDTSKHIEAYDIIYDICNEPPPEVEDNIFVYSRKVREDLYRHISEYLESYIEGVGETLNTNKLSTNNNEFILQFLQEWRKYERYQKILCRICKFLNHRWVVSERMEGNDEIVDIGELVWKLWKKIVFDNVCKHITNIILNLIEKERSGEAVDHVLLRDVLEVYVRLGSRKRSIGLDVYNEDFERYFLSDSTKFYENELQEKCNQNLRGILNHVQLRLHEEQERCSGSSVPYLHKSTYPKLVTLLRKILIDKYFDKIRTYFEGLSIDNVYNNQEIKSDLHAIYRHVKIDNRKCEQLANIYQNYILTYGRKELENCETAETTTFIETLYNVYDINLSLVFECFEQNIHFKNAIEKSFHILVNDNEMAKKNSTTPAKRLVKYCDLLLTTTVQHADDIALKQNIDKILKLFQFIDDKFMFEALYTKKLVERIIDSRSISDEAEQTIITRLEGIVPKNKISEVYKDIMISRYFNDRFKRHLCTVNLNNSIDFNVIVIKSNLWPEYISKVTCYVVALIGELTQYKNFYEAEHANRMLKWQYNLFMAELVTNYFPKKYKLKADIFYTTILLQFNETENCTVQQLQYNTKIEREYLIQILCTLLKYKWLESSDTKYSLTDNSIIKLNLNSNKNNKKRSILKLKLKFERNEQEILNNVEIKRKNIIMTTIMRVMKKHKVLNTTQICQYVCVELSQRFMPRINTIKESMKELVKKEYLRQQEDKYIYVP